VSPDHYRPRLRGSLLESADHVGRLRGVSPYARARETLTYGTWSTWSGRLRAVPCPSGGDEGSLSDGEVCSPSRTLARGSRHSEGEEE
jgi:hypothetical protein